VLFIRKVFSEICFARVIGNGNTTTGRQNAFLTLFEKLGLDPRPFAPVVLPKSIILSSSSRLHTLEYSISFSLFMESKELNIIELYNDTMEQFIAKPKKWGNSLGVTIPKEIIEKEGISEKTDVVFLVRKKGKKSIGDTFGTLHFEKSTDEIMKEIDEGWPHDW